MFGEVDPLVLNADKLPVLRAALANNPDVTGVAAPGADHTLARHSGFVGQDQARYYRPWTRSAVVFDALIQWFATRFT